MNKALWQLHIAVFLAGFTAILGKLIALNEGLIVWYRLLAALLILGLILKSRNEMKAIGFRDFISISAVGLVLGVHWVTFYGSIKYSTPSIAVVCISGAGFFSALIEPLILRRKIIPVELALGLISILGIYIIFDFHPQYKTGIIFGVISAFGSAVFPIYNKKLLEKFSPRVLTFYEFAGGFVVLTLLLPFYFSTFRPEYFLPTFSDLIWVLVLAFFCTVIAFDFQLNALKKISAFTCNLTYNLEPVYGVLLSFLIFHDHLALNAQFYFGLGLIVMSIFLQMVRVVKKQTVGQV